MRGTEARNVHVIAPRRRKADRQRGEDEGGGRDNRVGSGRFMVEQRGSAAARRLYRDKSSL